MQTLAKNTRYICEWGGYQIIITTNGQYAKAQVEKVDAGETTFMAELPRRTPDEAILWAANVLEGRGCRAIVDGQWRSLEDFFVFMPDGT